MSFFLREFRERGNGFVIVEPDESIFNGSYCRLKIKLNGHTESNLGEDGWQVAEFSWQVELVTGKSGFISVLLGPNIVKHLKQNHNYIFEFENNGNSFVEIISWRGIRPIGRSTEEILPIQETPLVFEPVIVPPVVNVLSQSKTLSSNPPTVIKCSSCDGEAVSSMERCPWCNYVF